MSVVWCSLPNISILLSVMKKKSSISEPLRELAGGASQSVAYVNGLWSYHPNGNHLVGMVGNGRYP